MSIGLRSGEYLGRKKSLVAGGSERLTDGAALMGSEIIHDDDVARSQRRNEDLVDVLAEGLAIDRAIDEPWRLDAIMPKGSEEGHGRPAAMWHLGWEALTARAPAGSGAILVLVQVSSMKTRRVGSIRSW
jgi:hypothetical protein